MNFGNFWKNNKTIDDSVGFTERLKYMTVPLVLTVGSYFMPEIKRKYGQLSEEQKAKYRKGANISIGILGTAATMYAGYRLYKDGYRDGKRPDPENNGNDKGQEYSNI